MVQYLVVGIGVDPAHEGSGIFVRVVNALVIPSTGNAGFATKAAYLQWPAALDSEHKHKTKTHRVKQFRFLNYTYD